ncbi:MAG TPA: CocE/NonD family hydrolase [Chloroflexota bacterium]|nr:CocE/NonD family hydrolase [Chloroflexota bacterium]
MAAQQSEPIYDVRLQRDMPMPMRDGTQLVADLYLPAGTGPWPTLLERTPYNKETSSEVSLGAGEFYASRGYAVVIQDVRGRFKSAGEFVPFHDDGWRANRDGYDTVEWIAGQPWSDGKVGTIGGSYSGATQYQMLPTRPPHLVAQFVRESSSDYRAEWVYRGGALELAFILPWALNVTLNNLPHLVPPEEVAARRGVLTGVRDEIGTWFADRPLAPCGFLAGLSDWYNRWLDTPDDGPLWWQWNVALKHQEVDTPVYHLGGWFDGFLRGTIENYKGIRARARSERARNAQKLIVGPWIHGPGNIDKRVVGEIDYGPEAAVQLNPVRLKWFDYWLKGFQNDVLDEPPVRFFTMGANTWQTASDWPPPDTRTVNLYLAGGKSGSARSLNDGRLSFEVPGATDSPDSYLYDPDHPVRTRGGGFLGDLNGGYDQQPVEPEVLTYTGEPLERDLEVSGPVTATLYAMSSARDTDWIVRISDVAPDGVSRLVADGILRARYRHSNEQPELLTPNQVEEFAVDLWHTSNLFRAGHRVRVAVTSSCFPRWDANPNTGEPFGTSRAGVVALNTIFHDAFRPSRVSLAVRGG